MAAVHQQQQPQPLSWNLFKPATWKKPKILKATQEPPSSLYYSNELKRWVEKGKENAAAEAVLAPPPKVLGGALPQQPATRRPINQRYVLQNNLSVSQSDLSKTQLLPPPSQHSSGRGLTPLKLNLNPLNLHSASSGMQRPASPSIFGVQRPSSPSSFFGALRPASPSFFGAQRPASPGAFSQQRPASPSAYALAASRSASSEINPAMLYAVPPPPRSAKAILLPASSAPVPMARPASANATTRHTSFLSSAAVEGPVQDPWGEFVSSRNNSQSGAPPANNSRPDVWEAPQADYWQQQGVGILHPFWATAGSTAPHVASMDMHRQQQGTMQQPLHAIAMDPASAAATGPLAAVVSQAVQTAVQQAVQQAIAKQVDNFEALFDEIMHPKDNRKLGGALPWELPREQRYSNDWLRHSRKAQQQHAHQPKSTLLDGIAAKVAAASKSVDQAAPSRSVDALMESVSTEHVMPSRSVDQPPAPLQAAVSTPTAATASSWQVQAGQEEESESCRRALEIARKGLPAIMSPAASSRSVSAALDARHAGSILDDTACSTRGTGSVSKGPAASGRTAGTPSKMSSARDRANALDDVAAGAQDAPICVPNAVASGTAQSGSMMPVAAAAALDMVSPRPQQPEAPPLSAEASDVDFGQLLGLDAPLPALAVTRRPNADEDAAADTPCSMATQCNDASSRLPAASTTPMSLPDENFYAVSATGTPAAECSAQFGGIQGSDIATGLPPSSVVCDMAEGSGESGVGTLPGAHAICIPMEPEVLPVVASAARWQQPKAASAFAIASGAALDPAGPSTSAAATGCAPLPVHDIVKGIATISELKQSLLSDENVVDADSIGQLIKLKAAVEHMLTRTEATASAMNEQTHGSPKALSTAQTEASSAAAGAAAAMHQVYVQASPAQGMLTSVKPINVPKPADDDVLESPFLAMPPFSVLAQVDTNRPQSRAAGPPSRTSSLHQKAAAALAAAAQQDKRAGLENGSATVQPKGSTWQQYERKIALHRKQLDSTKVQLDTALKKLNDMQSEFDELLVCLGMESAKNQALCDALRAAGIDPGPIIAAVEAEWVNEPF